MSLSRRMDKGKVVHLHNGILVLTPLKSETIGQAVVVNAFNASTQEAEAGGSLEDQGQPGL